MPYLEANPDPAVDLADIQWFVGDENPRIAVADVNRATLAGGDAQASAERQHGRRLRLEQRQWRREHGRRDVRAVDRGDRLLVTCAKPYEISPNGVTRL